MAHVSTHWQVRLQSDPDWSTPERDVTLGGAGLTVYSPTGLVELTEYLMRAALIDSVDGQGAWSTDQQFTTLAANVEPEPAPDTEWSPVC